MEATILIFALFLISSSQSLLQKNYKIDSSIYSVRDENKDWWKNGVFYQIYPRSFKDSSNEGNGTLQGIISKLEHLKDMGVTATWLSPVYQSPQVDQGYDISDYEDIDPMYGNLTDLKTLIDEAHRLGIKVILDFVPNHTSDKHKWFQASLSNDSKYADYYIWEDAKYSETGERITPNNWVSNFGGSAWTWSDERQQFYFHQFAAQQPDLNYRNPKVVEEMKNVIRHWLNFGADGFRMDAVYTLFEDKQLRDEPHSASYTEENKWEYGSLVHIYTADQDETIDMIYQWRECLDEFNNEHDSYERIMMTEVYSNANNTMLYYGMPDGSRRGAHFTFNFLAFVTGLYLGFTANDLINSVDYWQGNLPPIYVANWVLGNHDQRRVGSRLGVQHINSFNMLATILPGVQITYMGEEIGMEDGEVTCAQGFDPQAIKNCETYDKKTRDYERTPYQWDNSTNAGFNLGAKTWLPVSQKYLTNNLAAQMGDDSSHYNIYKKLIQLRKDFKQTTNDSLTLTQLSDNVVEVIRETNAVKYVMIWNIGAYEENIEIPDGETFTVAVSSLNRSTETEIFSSKGTLRPYESILLKAVL